MKGKRKPPPPRRKASPRVIMPSDLSQVDRAELANFYHAARVALDNPTRGERLAYAAKAFNRLHREVPVHVAYIAADRATDLAGDEVR